MLHAGTAGVTLEVIPRPAALLLGIVLGLAPHHLHQLYTSGRGGRDSVCRCQGRESCNALLLRVKSLYASTGTDIAPSVTYLCSLFRQKPVLCCVDEIKHFSLCNYHVNLIQSVEARYNSFMCVYDKYGSPRAFSDPKHVVGFNVSRPINMRCTCALIARKEIEFGGLARHCLFYFLLYKWIYVIVGTT